MCGRARMGGAPALLRAAQQSTRAPHPPTPIRPHPVTKNLRPCSLGTALKNSCRKSSLGRGGERRVTEHCFEGNNGQQVSLNPAWHAPWQACLPCRAESLTDPSQASSPTPPPALPSLPTHMSLDTHSSS